MNPFALVPKSPPEVPPREHHVWTVTKRGHLAECRVRVTPGGPELRILVAGELLWSHVYASATEEILTAEADRKRLKFHDKGWSDAAPRLV